MLILLRALTGITAALGLRMIWRACFPPTLSLAEQLQLAGTPAATTGNGSVIPDGTGGATAAGTFLAGSSSAANSNLGLRRQGSHEGVSVGQVLVTVRAYMARIGLLGTANRRPALDADLAVLERTPATYGIQRLTMALVCASFPLLFVAMTIGVGGVQWNPITVTLLVPAGAAIGLLLARQTVHAAAQQHRQTYAVELAHYLEIVALQLAGGTGVDEAMRRATITGTTTGITQIRRALTTARNTNRSTWDTLDELAQRTHVPELEELIVATKLAGNQGAHIKQTLLAKAETLRTTKANDDLAKAIRASEHMEIPVTFMFLAFLILAIAPLAANLFTLNN